MGWGAGDIGDLSHVRALVTGANSGIGWQTALALAGHGAEVTLACRDLVRGESALRRLVRVHPAARVRLTPLDLASMRSVRAAAEAWDGPLHLLVNNAGVMAPPRPTTTEDGYELQFGTNHLGHFVLTGMLLEALVGSGGGRVVTVSSIAHHGGGPEVVEGNTGAGYRPPRAYADSKLANLLFARELQRRADEHGAPLVSVAAHPGVSATGLVSDRQGMGARRMTRTVAPLLLRAFTQSAAAGARPVLFAATVAGPGSYTGPSRLGETRGPVGPARVSVTAQDDALARRLWHVSEELTGLRYAWPVGASSARAAGAPGTAGADGWDGPAQ